MDAVSVIGDNEQVGDARDRPAPTGDGSSPAGRELVTTPTAATTLGISARTLQRYVEQGVLSPAVTLPSGQYRWDVGELTRRIAELAEDHGPGLADRTGQP